MQILPIPEALIRAAARAYIQQHGVRGKKGAPALIGLDPETLLRIAAEAPVQSGSLVKAAHVLGLLAHSAQPMALSSQPAFGEGSR